MKASSHLPLAMLVVALAATPSFARGESPAARTSPLHPIVIIATPTKTPSLVTPSSVIAPSMMHQPLIPSVIMPLEFNQIVPVLPGEIVGPLPREITRPLSQQVVRALPGQIVRPLSGQIVQPLPGQIVQPLPGQIVR